MDRVTSIAQLVADAIAHRRFYAATTVAFGLLALALGVAGVFAAVAAAVEERRRDIGVHIALGADPRTVLWIAMRSGLAPVFVGLVLGSVVSLWIARSLRALLFQLSPLDPVSFALALSVLATSAVVAAWLPARRALTLDPAVTLRQD